MQLSKEQGMDGTVPPAECQGTDAMTNPSLHDLAAERLSQSSFGARLKTRIFEGVILFWSLLFGAAIMTVFKVYRARPHQVRWILWLWSTGFIRAAKWIVGVRYTVEGLDQVPKTPVIFVCNHQSYWESIALTSFIRDVNVVSKAEAMDIPVFGWGLRYAPMIPVHRTKRGTNLRRIVKGTVESLDEGRNVLIFPEGTRVKPGKTRDYLRGLGLMYQAAKVPIVPIVHNAGLCWTEGFQTKHAGHITMRFLPAIPAGQDPKATMDELEALLNREKDRVLAMALADGAQASGQRASGVTIET